MDEAPIRFPGSMRSLVISAPRSPQEKATQNAAIAFFLLRPCCSGD